MQRHNLHIALEENFLLIAIHCHTEAYKLAFLINKFLSLKLKRKQNDLDFFRKESHITYPVYEYFDESRDDAFYLISNKCKTIAEKITGAGSLFDSDSEEKTHYLVSEFKQTDFLLKIVSEDTPYYENRIVSELSKMPYVITAYTIDQSKLKTKQNLNFD